MNNQWTIGTISKLRKDFTSGLTGEVGIDLRTASIDHYRDVRDLLGGQYWVDTKNEFAGSRNAVFGDKIDYYNTNTVNWLGGYVQVEKATQSGSIYGMVGGAENSYHYTDHFRKASNGTELDLTSGWLRGYQIKGGVNRNLNDQWSIFGNAGYVSKVPIFDGAIDDVNGVVNTNPKNEKFTSFEVGLNYTSANRGLTGSLNLYHTTWRATTSSPTCWAWTSATWASSCRAATSPTTCSSSTRRRPSVTGTTSTTPAAGSSPATSRRRRTTTTTSRT